MVVQTMVIIHVISKVYLQDQSENTVQNNPRRSKELARPKWSVLGCLILSLVWFHIFIGIQLGNFRATQHLVVFIFFC
jgi:tryptophan-rich sensory protein